MDIFKRIQFIFNFWQQIHPVDSFFFYDSLWHDIIACNKTTSLRQLPFSIFTLHFSLSDIPFMLLSQFVKNILSSRYISQTVCNIYPAQKCPWVFLITPSVLQVSDNMEWQRCSLVDPYRNLPGSRSQLHSTLPKNFRVFQSVVCCLAVVQLLTNGLFNGLFQCFPQFKSRLTSTGSRATRDL